MAERTPGDDIDVRVRIRRANLPALLEGVTLGMDSLTRRPIRLRLVEQPDGVHALEIEANAITAASTPDPVDQTPVFDPLADLAENEDLGDFDHG